MKWYFLLVIYCLEVGSGHWITLVTFTILAKGESAITKIMIDVIIHIIGITVTHIQSLSSHLS